MFVQLLGLLCVILSEIDSPQKNGCVTPKRVILRF